FRSSSLLSARILRNISTPMPSLFRAVLLPVLPIAFTVGTLVLTACSGVYFNTTFNAEKSHEKALSLRAERLRENPDDTVQVSAEERLLLQRAVRKSSKVL